MMENEKLTRNCTNTNNTNKELDYDEEIGESGTNKNKESHTLPTIITDVLQKKKFKRSPITICLTNCRYDAIRRITNEFGIREVSDHEPWNIYWTDMSVSIERAKEMKRFQRINHFPGMLEICRKDLLARNLNRMQKMFPKEYNFFPKTWCLPADFGDALNYSKTRKNKTFIIKPECGSQGRGIYLTKSLKDVKPSDKLICQLYISRPYLLDGYKFDIRVYTLITSCDPLRIFVYNEGLVRFATSQYADPSIQNTTNVYMHLTNYALNKHSRMFVHDAEAGSKRKISTLNRLLTTRGVQLSQLWAAVDQTIVKTVISAWPVLKHSYHACFPTHDMVHACFEILGFDILLDHKLHPFILEVNHSPSFHTDSALDREVKESLLRDTLLLLNVNQADRRRFMHEDRLRVRQRLLQTVSKDSRTSEQPASYQREIEKCPWLKQIQWEEIHHGNFRRVYPVGDRYATLFQQPAGSVFLATVSSQARGDCTRIQRQEFEHNKAKQEALIIPPVPMKPIKEQTKKEEVPNILDSKKKERNNSKSLPLKKKEREEKKIASITTSNKKTRHVTDKNIDKNNLVSNSYEPSPILEVEERDRIMQLAQRDFLIRSYGMLEQVYLVMKKLGTLRPEDEKKYGFYGKQPVAVVKSVTIKEPNTETSIVRGTSTHTVEPTKSKGLEVNCAEAIIYRRSLSRAAL